MARRPSVKLVCQAPDMFVTVVPSMPPSVICSAAPGWPPEMTRAPFANAGAGAPPPRNASSTYANPAAPVSNPCGMGLPVTASDPDDTSTVEVKEQQSLPTVQPASTVFMSPQKPISSASNGEQ